MAFDYTALRDETVEPLLEEFGGPGTIEVNDPSTGAPYASQLGSGTPYPITQMKTRFKKADNNGTLIEVGDILLLVSTRGVIINPELAHRVTIKSVMYQVIRVDPVGPGPVVLFWYVHVRK